MTQRPTFQAQIAHGGSRGATNLHGERSIEQRLAALERIVSETPRFKVGTITISSGTGTEAFTGVGFKPRLLLLYGTVFGDSDSVATMVQGAATSSTAYASAIRIDSTDGQRYDAAKLYVVLSDNNATVDADGDLDSFDADGFTIDRTTSAGVSLTLGYIAIS